MFVIREKNTGAFCTGQRFRSFSMDMQSAAQFASRENATKAIKGMFEKPGSVGREQYNTWAVDNQAYHPNVQAYLEQCWKSNDDLHAKHIKETFLEKKCDMEVLEVKLILVDE